MRETDLTMQVQVLGRLLRRALIAFLFAAVIVSVIGSMRPHGMRALRFYSPTRGTVVYAMKWCGFWIFEYYPEIHPRRIPTTPSGWSMVSSDAVDHCPQVIANLPHWLSAFRFAINGPCREGTCTLIMLRPWFITASAVALLIGLEACLFIIRRRRALKGLCIDCAYDLTGNTSGHCPECGKTIPPRINGPKP